MLPLAVAGGGALASIAGGIIGNYASAGDRKKAMEMLQQSVAEIEAVGAPPDVAREIILEKFQQAGMLTPEAEQSITLGVSQVAQTQTDQATKEAQMNALDIISQRARGGLTAEDKAALAQAQSETQQQAQGQQQQIIQEMQQRGMAGAGAELAARLSAGQASTGRLAQQGRDIAAQASQNALQAAAQSGSLAGNIRQQGFSEDVTRGTAADQIAQFNAQNALAQQQRNVGARNAAQATNIGRQQQVSDKNIGGANEEQARQREAEKWMYSAALQKAQAAAAARSGVASQYQNQANQTAGMWGSIGSGVATGASGIATGMQNQQNFQSAMDRGYNPYGGGNTYQFKAAHGGEVPGAAVVEGDSSVNDKVEALLSPGEIVLPRSVVQSPNAPQKAAEFVNELKGQEDPVAKVKESIFSSMTALTKVLKSLEKGKK